MDLKYNMKSILPCYIGVQVLGIIFMKNVVKCEVFTTVIIC